MSTDGQITISLDRKEFNDLKTYCELNKLDQSKVIKDSFLQGFRIEKYGLLTPLDNIKGKVVEKEVIKEVPVEIIKEVVVEKIVEVPREVIKEVPVEIIKEVPVEKVVEVIKEITKEVPVEKVVVKEIVKEVPVEKVVYVTDQQELNEKIFQKEQDFEEERKRFSTKLQENENVFQQEKNELLVKIKELESKEPEVREVEKIVYQEKVVEVEKDNSDLKPKFDQLQQTLQKLRAELIEKDKKLKETENALDLLKKSAADIPATFLRGSNLDDKLYK